MDAALGLGLGDALDAMGPALVLEDGVGAVALHRERVGAVAGGYRLGAEAAALGVLRQHPLQVSRPEARLVAARPGPHLDDHVLVVVRIALDHGQPDGLVQLGQALLRRGEQLAQLGVVPILAHQLSRPGGVVGGAAPVGRQLRRGLELAVLAADLRVAVPVRDHLRIRHRALEVGEARLDLLDELLDHGSSLGRDRPADRSCQLSVVSAGDSASRAGVNADRSAPSSASSASGRPSTSGRAAGSAWKAKWTPSR